MTILEPGGETASKRRLGPCGTVDGVLLYPHRWASGWPAVHAKGTATCAITLKSISIAGELSGAQRTYQAKGWNLGQRSNKGHAVLLLPQDIVGERDSYTSQIRQSAVSLLQTAQIHYRARSSRSTQAPPRGASLRSLQQAVKTLHSCGVSPGHNLDAAALALGCRNCKENQVCES